MGNQEPVYFLMPDGKKVSNDPNFDSDEEAEEGAEGYAAMSAKELKAEVASRNEDRNEEDQIDISKMKKKSEIVAALEADDEE